VVPSFTTTATGVGKTTFAASTLKTMETPKLYYLGEKEVSGLIRGAQGEIIPQEDQGEPRGENSTDLQFDRAQEGQVPSGSNAFIGGGQNNRVSGNNSFAAAGFQNDIPGPKAFAAGEYNIVEGRNASALGSVNQVSGDNSHARGSGHFVDGEAGMAEGDGNMVSGHAGHAEGFMNISEGDCSHAEGMNAVAYNHFQHAKSAGGFANPGEMGEAQYTNIIARRATEDSEARELLLGEEGRILLMDNKMNAFRILVVASNQDQSEGAGWELKGLICKQGPPSTTTLVGDVHKTAFGPASETWNVNVAADTENGALSIMATGEEGKNLRWVAFVEMAEVAFYS